MAEDKEQKAEGGKKPDEKKDEEKEEEEEQKGYVKVDYFVKSRKALDEYYYLKRKIQIESDNFQELITQRTKMIMEIAKGMISKHRDGNPVIFQGHLMPTLVFQKIRDAIIDMDKAKQQYEIEPVPDKDMLRYLSHQDLINEKFNDISQLSIDMSKKANQIADEVNYIGPMPVDINEEGKIIKRKIEPPPTPLQK